MKFRDYLKEADFYDADWAEGSEKLFKLLRVHNPKVQPQALKTNNPVKMKNKSLADFMTLAWGRMR